MAANLHRMTGGHTFAFYGGYNEKGNICTSYVGDDTPFQPVC